MEQLLSLYKASKFNEFLETLIELLQNSEKFNSGMEELVEKGLKLLPLLRNSNQKNSIQIDLANELYRLERFDYSSHLFKEVLKTKNVKLKKSLIYSAFKSSYNNGDVLYSEKFSGLLAYYLYSKKQYSSLLTFVDELSNYGITFPEMKEYEFNSLLSLADFETIVQKYGDPLVSFLKDGEVPKYLIGNEKLEYVLSSNKVENSYISKVQVLEAYSHFSQLKDKGSEEALKNRKIFFNKIFELLLSGEATEECLEILFEYGVMFNRKKLAESIFNFLEKNPRDSVNLNKMSERIEKIVQADDVNVELESNVDLGEDLFESETDVKNDKQRILDLVETLKKQGKEEEARKLLAEQVPKEELEKTDIRSRDEIYKSLMIELRGDAEFVDDEFFKRSESQMQSFLKNMEPSYFDEYYADVFGSLFMIGMYEACLDLVNTKIQNLPKECHESEVINLEYLRLRCLVAKKRNREAAVSAKNILTTYPLKFDEKMNFLSILSISLRGIGQLKEAIAVKNLQGKMRRTARLEVESN